MEEGEAECLPFQIFLFVLLPCIQSMAVDCLRITDWAEQEDFWHLFCFCSRWVERKIFLAVYQKKTEQRPGREADSISSPKRYSGMRTVTDRRTSWSVLHLAADDSNLRRADMGRY